MDDDKIIRAIREASLKEMLREEERKISRRSKIAKLSTMLAAAAAVIAAVFFVLKPSFSGYFAVVDALKSGKAPEEILQQIGSFYSLVSDSNELEPSEIEFYTLGMNYLESLAHLKNSDFKKAEPLLRKVSESQSKYAPSARKCLGEMQLADSSKQLAG